MEGGVILMKKFWRTLTVLVSVSCLILSFTLAGCSSHPNEKHCQAYEDQLNAATAAEDQLQDSKQALADAEAKLDAQKQKLEDAKGETEKVNQRLSDL
jgi:nucleotide-binding universal stress UspA family protein